ncbi:hypothetical protein [Fibrella aquatica]|uniref:hypothetical protein n=1 Tax=Fibrella aquatica TaxID=3242487 RepID=UPI003521F02C
MKFSLLLVLIVLSGGSCREQQQVIFPTPVDVCPLGNTVTTPAKGYQVISGSWQWVQSVSENRLSGTRISTPSSTRKTRRFVFNIDRTYQYFVDQKLQESGTYELRNASNDPILILQLQQAGQSTLGGVFITLCDTGLILEGNAGDGGENESYTHLP